MEKKSDNETLQEGEQDAEAALGLHLPCEASSACNDHNNKKI